MIPACKVWMDRMIISERKSKGSFYISTVIVEFYPFSVVYWIEILKDYLDIKNSCGFECDDLSFF